MTRRDQAERRAHDAARTCFGRRTVLGALAGMSASVGSLLFTGLSPVSARESDVLSTVSQEADERVVRRFFAALDAGDFEAIRGLLAPDFVLRVVRPNVTLGPTRFVSALRLLRESFPDLAFELRDVDGGDETITARWVATGTFEGEFAGVDPTGDVVRVPGTAVLRVVDGLIAEIRVRLDLLALLSQVGLGVLN